MRKHKKIVANLAFLSHELIERKIFMIRNQKVMIDHDLASLYGVSTKILNQAVKRNKRSFSFRLHVSAQSV